MNESKTLSSTLLKAVSKEAASKTGRKSSLVILARIPARTVPIDLGRLTK